MKSVPGSGLHRGDADAGTGVGGGLAMWADPVNAGLATAARLWAGVGGERNVGSDSGDLRRVMPMGGYKNSPDDVVELGRSHAGHGDPQRHA